MRLLAIWTINALALLALPYVVPSVQVASFGTALLVALLTLGLFIFVINALLFQLAGNLIDGFRVGGFASALWGSIGYSVISWALSTLLFPAGKR